MFRASGRFILSLHLRVAISAASIETDQPGAGQRYLAYSIPAVFRKEIGAPDYGFCVLWIAAARPPVVKD